MAFLEGDVGARGERRAGKDGGLGFVIVFMGAGIGGALRHGINLAALRLGWTGFGGATMAINVAGSFAMGLAVAYAARSGLGQPWRLFLTTGILGGFTTFSAFSLDTVVLIQRGRTDLAAAYVIGSVVLSVGALMAAMVVARP